jgi:uncharacterized phiE125 gp8 family phage protein
MLRPIRTAAPALRVVDVEEAKAHLRVEVDDEDDLIEGLVLAAESRLDGWAGLLGRCMINQTWRASYASWCGPVMELPFPDVSSVDVTYFDSDGVEQTLSDVHYGLIETAGGTAIEWRASFAAPSLSSRSDAVRVSMVTGFGAAASEVPEAIRHAIKLMVGGWYENREESVIGVSVASLPVSLAAESLIAPYRRSGLCCGREYSTGG